MQPALSSVNLIHLRSVAAALSNMSSGTSTTHQIWSYVVFNSLFAVIISFNLSLLAGLWYYPARTLVGFIIPYYTYTKVLAPSEFMATGARWKSFSKNFVLLRIMRKHLSLRFAPPPKKLVEAEGKPDAQFLIAVFPHGVASDFRIAMDGMMHEVFPNVHDKVVVLTASVLFAIPLIRELALSTGCVDARKSVAEKAIGMRRSILVLPGGEAEQIRTIYQRERVYLKRRKGFIKLALKHGIPVVPSYLFGVNDYYYTSSILFQPRLWLQKSMGICIPMAVGLYGSIFCPFSVPTTVVYGEPLSFKVKDKTSPTSDELDVAHDQFCTALKHLFDQHKKEYGYGERELEIM